jgi:RNA polymerase sigma-70 factor (ECF subfamily)
VIAAISGAAPQCRAIVGPMRDDDWPNLLARAQQGDEAAYRRFLGESAGFLRAIVARTGIPADAIEDVVQEALITIHAIRHTYDPARPVRPWLTAIARRRAVDWRRRRTGISRNEVAMPEHAAETFADPESNRELERGDSGETVRRWVAKLPPGQRQAVEMLKLKEMSLAEAAAQSGQSITALKVATHRALANLRKMWKKETT